MLINNIDVAEIGVMVNNVFDIFTNGVTEVVLLPAASLRAKVCKTRPRTGVLAIRNRVPS